MHLTLMSTNSSIYWLDIRPSESFHKSHVRGSGHVPLDELSQNVAMLPPRKATLHVIVDDDISPESIAQLARGTLKHYQCTFLTLAEVKDEVIESGEQRARLWKPGFWLEQQLPGVLACLGDDARAVDLACGSGRDVVYLCEQHAWRSVLGVDSKQALLDVCSAIAARSTLHVQPTLLCLDMEAENGEEALREAVGACDLVHVRRYLHRPLMPLLRDLVRPGGFVIYETFMVGCESHPMGKPRRPQFLLRPGELRDEHFADWRIVAYEETTIEDGRPVERICAQRPANEKKRRERDVG